MLKVEAAKGNDIALIIGITGAGKSTVANYLIGHKLKKITKNGKIAVDIDYDEQTYEQLDYSIIGHNVSTSETLFP